MLIAWIISSNVSKGRSTKDDQIRKLERDFKVMKDNYDKICSENQQLNALFTRQQKDKEKRRARDEALKEARERCFSLVGGWSWHARLPRSRPQHPLCGSQEANVLNTAHLLM